MPECTYCGATFEDEDAHRRHLLDAHAGELGPIDRRRVADLESDGSPGLPTGPLVLGGVLVIAVLVVAYVVLFAGGGGGDGPGAVGSAHGHGTMEMVVVGEGVDFAQPRYQLQADRFHFERMNGEPNGRVWHAHAEGITLGWAMQTLGIEVTADSVTYQGTTYRDGEDYDISITVDGEPVDPETYELRGASVENLEAGDSVRIVVSDT